ncbi:concanavalin A-like lectin/glucanase domain-containing protein [Artemisia annua]|uniref:Concanavalin A-like lectin/glucanase domain-containing protein n=1 Tax=Artemisia annua TaxID=35608 RepID=A0A2U1L8K5_ARTAN|nr:concanavalin A-like lectin/glucanase domain-containing protein [Artemisia annua]
MKNRICSKEDELARKMVTVSLWCIQSNPSDRPSISKVVEMLEGSFNHYKFHLDIFAGHISQCLVKEQPH